MEEAYLHLSEFRTVITLPNEAPDAFIRTNPFRNSYNETSGGYYVHWLEVSIKKYYKIITFIEFLNHNKIMKKNKLFKISILLNVLFICLTLLVGVKYYSKIKSRVFKETITPTKKYKSSSDKFYNASDFEILGKLPNTKLYSRLPENAKNKVNKTLWKLSKNAAGISIRFRTNSSSIKIRWTLNNNIVFMNMTPIASKGLDLYTYIDNKWQFVGVAEPTGSIENESTIISNMKKVSREYLLNLPLYDGVSSIEIGIDKGSSISKSIKKIINRLNPIVFYGTSITQGSSASRPGLIYTSLLERSFNKEVINLGFSGNGFFDKEIAKYIMTVNPSAIILDCTPNSKPEIIKENLPKTIEYIRSINETVPIILVESIIRDYAFFKVNDKYTFGTMEFIKNQNNSLQEIYNEKIKKHKKIYYISSQTLIGSDHESTIDGTHFNDLGHFRAYEVFRKKLATIL